MSGLLDSVTAQFYSTSDLRELSRILDLLRYIFGQGPAYRPVRWRAKHATRERMRRFREAELASLTGDLDDQWSFLLNFEQDPAGAYGLLIDLGLHLPDKPWYLRPGRVLLSLPHEHFRGPDAEAHVEQWLSVLGGIYEHGAAYYGFSHESRDNHALTTLTTTVGAFRETRNRTDAYAPALFWSNFLGPHLVDEIGRERLEQAHCWRRQALADGGMLLVFSPNPLEFESTREERALLYREWGLERLTMPPDRAAAPQPPAPPTTPPAVDSVRQCREYAELCVRTARKLNGAELDYSPGSLARLDAIIRTGWKTGAEPHEVVVVMGCYVGETIIRNLGGHWSWEDAVPGLTQPHVRLGRQRVNVIGKVTKRFRLGDSDSLAWFYEVVAAKHREQAGGSYHADSP